MQNLVNFFCPDILFEKITRTGKVGAFRAAVENDLQEQKAVAIATQVLVFKAVYGTLGANRVMVQCTNNAIGDGWLIKAAVETALEKVYPEIWKKKGFVVLQLLRH